MTSNDLITYDKTQNSIWYDFLFNLSYRGHNKSFLDLLKFIGDNTKDNINVKFIRSKGDTTRLHTSFEEIYKITGEFSYITSKEERDLWNYLIEKGLDLKSESIRIKKENQNEVDPQIIANEYEALKMIQDKDVDIEYYHSLFTNLKHKNIFLLEKHSEIYGLEETKKYLLKYLTLHQAVKDNNIEFTSFLFDKYKIDVNTKDEQGQTPLMLVRSPELLELILTQKPNAILKDIENNDAIKKFSYKIKSGHNEFMQMAISLEKYILENPAINQETHEEQVKRKEDVLINFVETDKTKKDVETYIKKVKLKNLDKIVNKDGLNLAYISLKKESWAKFFMFYSNENSQFATPKTNITYLQVMLGKYIRSRIDPAKDILNVLIKDFKGNIGDVIENLVQEQIEQGIPFQLPEWIIKNNVFSQFITNKTNLIPTFKSLDKIYNFEDFENKKKDISNNLNTFINIIKITKPNHQLTFDFSPAIQWSPYKENDLLISKSSLMNFFLIKSYTNENPEIFSKSHIENIEKIDEKNIALLINKIKINTRESKFTSEKSFNSNSDLYASLEYYHKDMRLIRALDDDDLNVIKKDDDALFRKIKYHHLNLTITNKDIKSATKKI